MYRFLLSLLLVFILSVATTVHSSCTADISSTLIELGQGIAAVNAAKDANVRPDNFLSLSGGKSSSQRQALTVQPGPWITIAESPIGTAGAITNLWIALNDCLDGNSICTAQTTRNSAIRITFNNATIPQFGGETGINFEYLFGRAQVSLVNAFVTTEVLRSDNIGNHYFPEDVRAMTGFFRFNMPFTNGFKVEYNSGCNDSPTRLWSNVEWTSSIAKLGSVNWVLNAKQSPPAITNFTAIQLDPLATDFDSVKTKKRYITSNRIENLATRTLLSWTESDSEKRFAFLGSLHTIRTGNTPPSNRLAFLEGDYRFYSDSAEPTYHNSGTEDYFMSDYYFAHERIKYYNYWGYMLVENTSQNWGLLNAYRFFKYDELASASTNFTVTWTNGDPPGHGDGISSGQHVRTGDTLFYYTSDQ